MQSFVQWMFGVALLVPMVFLNKGFANTEAQRVATIVVKSGDTLQTISMRLYGTTRKWHALYLKNKEILKNPEELIVGMTLKTLQVPSQTGELISTPITNTQAQQPVSAQACHTIKPGDTLGEIAQAAYGSKLKWKRLLKLNPHIEDPTKLIVGTNVKTDIHATCSDRVATEPVKPIKSQIAPPNKIVEQRVQAPPSIPDPTLSFQTEEEALDLPIKSHSRQQFHQPQPSTETQRTPASSKPPIVLKRFSDWHYL